MGHGPASRERAFFRHERCGVEDAPLQFRHHELPFPRQTDKVDSGPVRKGDLATDPAQSVKHQRRVPLHPLFEVCLKKL